LVEEVMVTETSVEEAEEMEVPAILVVGVIVGEVVAEGHLWYQVLVVRAFVGGVVAEEYLWCQVFVE
jgi:hypothetical protein